MFFIRWKNALAGFFRPLNFGQRALLATLILLVGVAIVTSLASPASQMYSTYRFNHLSSTEHLKQAKAVCGPLVNSIAHICNDPVDALRNLEKIPSHAPEYAEASILVASIRQQKHAAVTEAAERSQRQLEQDAAP